MFYRKPLVSSTHMKVRMENRRMVKLSTLHTKSKSSLDGDWVTIGVLISKSDPKVSQKVCPVHTGRENILNL